MTTREVMRVLRAAGQVEIPPGAMERTWQRLLAECPSLSDPSPAPSLVSPVAGEVADSCPQRGFPGAPRSWRGNGGIPAQGAVAPPPGAGTFEPPEAA